jgi:hypothetical protein
MAPTSDDLGVWDHKRVDWLRVRWADGSETRLNDVSADRQLTVERDAPPQPSAGCSVGWR